MSYRIITDGSCDLSKEHVDRANLTVVPFYVSFDEKTYMKENVDIGIRDFYQHIVDNPTVFPKSSMPSSQDYIDVFEPIIKDGEDVLCLCITTKFSGSYNSAMTAKDILLETYPDARIEVIDTTVNTVLQGILVEEAARMQANGMTLDDAIKSINKIKTTGRIIFTVGNLEYLIHGGRIGKVMGKAVDTLGIKPMIILKEGEIFSNGVARSRKASIKKLLVQIREHFEEVHESPDNYRIVVGFGYDYDEAVGFRDALLTSLSEYSNIKDIEIYQIGATIAVHTGPYPLGVGLIKKYDA